MQNHMLVCQGLQSFFVVLYRKALGHSYGKQEAGGAARGQPKSTAESSHVVPEISLFFQSWQQLEATAAASRHHCPVNVYRLAGNVFSRVL